MYRMYVAEAIKNLTKTAADGFGKEGAVYMSKSYLDIIYPQKESDRTADDIINSIKQKLKEYE